MKKLVLMSALMSSLSAIAQSESDAVKVTINQSEQGYTLTCEALKPMGELPENWVEMCNQQAHDLLAHESSYGKPVKVLKEPFGMAGKFAAQLAASLPAGVTPERITSPDLTLELQ